MTEIFNCPFCNSDNLTIDVVDFFSVECGDCNAIGPSAQDKNNAIAKWNLGEVLNVNEVEINAHRKIIHSCLVLLRGLAHTTDEEELIELVRIFLNSMQENLLKYSDQNCIDAFIVYRKLAVQKEVPADKRVFAIFNFMNTVREKMKLAKLTMKQYQHLIFDL